MTKHTGRVTDLRLTVDSRPRWIRVTIHPDAEDLQRAAQRTSGGQPWDGVVGCFHPSPFKAKYGGKGKPRVDTTTPYAGHMRLAHGWLTPEIVIHESTHAALHLYRLDQWSVRTVGTDADLGEGCGPEEEAYAHLHGRLAAAVLEMVQSIEQV